MSELHSYNSQPTKGSAMTTTKTPEPVLSGHPPVMNTKQVAQFIGSTEAALAQDRYMGKGLPYVKIGGRVRYRQRGSVRPRDDCQASLHPKRPHQSITRRDQH
jgi:hypothetical protein